MYCVLLEMIKYWYLWFQGTLIFCSKNWLRCIYLWVLLYIYIKWNFSFYIDFNLDFCLFVVIYVFFFSLLMMGTKLKIWQLLTDKMFSLACFLRKEKRSFIFQQQLKGHTWGCQVTGETFPIYQKKCLAKKKKKKEGGRIITVENTACFSSTFETFCEMWEKDLKIQDQSIK